jgi:collagen type V/XI/XXIV/XXVII alpha
MRAIAPSEGLYQHVNAPKQRQRGAGRAAAAAANPGNWFWMDVYWK